MENKIDAELVKVIESSISNSKTCMEALDKVLDWEKKKQDPCGVIVMSKQYI